LTSRIVAAFDTLHAMEASGRAHEKLDGEEDAAQAPAAETKPG